MDKDEIIRMAREAGFEVVDGQLRLYFDGSKALLKPNYMGTVVDGMKEFAKLVAANEREKQAEQEPVAWLWRCKPYCDWPNWSVSIKRPVDSGCGDFPKTEGYEDTPLYTHPVRTKDLTDDEIESAVANLGFAQLSPIEVARAVIAADRKKNK